MKQKFLIILLTISNFTFCSQFSNNNDEDKNKNQLLGLAALALGNTQVTSSISFSLNSGTTKNIDCSSSLSNVSGGTITLSDFRLYISDVKLVTSSGISSNFNLVQDNKWQSATTALLDFEDKTGNCTNGTTETNTKITGTYTSGNYSGIQFTVGVPFSENHIDNTTAKAPLDVNGMFWSWNGGYKFTKFEFKNNATNSIAIHIGNSSCTPTGNSPTSCSYPNYSTVTLTGTSGFVPGTNKIAIDVSSLLNGSDTSSTGLTCMGASNTTSACKVILNNLGIKETDGTSMGTQSVFSLE
ncbi:MAG: metallo-mystery pair system four-Cys motif protein [Leptospiraceae bacterium]|nr:metallo-mystery pair system four-Cys motif protein [Leptospiraceae bacterium]MCP5511853.1 metallo-mystery pair system four-Cys motif protein [Leptospiraceae bacterium]